MNGAILLTAIFCASVSFFLGLLAAMLLQGGDHKMFVDLTIAGIGSFGGSIAGGYSAFALEARRRQREQLDRHIAAANVALVTLMSMWSALYNYEKKVVRTEIADDQSPDPLWLRLRPAVAYWEPLVFNVEGLVFLLKTRDPEVLPELILQGQRYRDVGQALVSLEKMRGRVLERMEHFGVSANPTHGELMYSAGPIGVVQLRTITKSLIEYVYRCLSDMLAFHGRFQGLLRDELGEENVKAFSFEDFASELPMPVASWIERGHKMCDAIPK